MQLATQFVGGRLSLLNHNNAGGSAGSAMTRVVSLSGFQIRGPIMGASPTDPVGSLLCLVMLVLASVAVSLSSVRFKAALHILAGMAVGLAAGVRLVRCLEALNSVGNSPGSCCAAARSGFRFAKSDARGIPIPHRRARQNIAI